jgi:lysine 6-dehydrogenase
MKMLVLGAGLQGSACAFDLLQNPAVTEVRLADLNVRKLPEFLAPYSGERLIPTPLDARDTEAVAALMSEADAAMCALPYYFNLEMTRLAIEGGAHFSDLGGNTGIVEQQKELDETARARGISVVPDCGLAPGMVNILAQYGIDQLDTVSAVRIFVGGLPLDPQPPLNYQIVYSLEGVLDYYTTPSWVLRDGRRAQVAALSGIEPVDFPAPIGTLEAFHTAGGLSTMASRYEGKIPTMEYKTLRYSGHARIMEAIRELGLLDLQPVDVKGTRIIPRDAFISIVQPKLTREDSPDVVALRVTVTGTKGGKERELGWELIDRYDEARGISAMMRTTGYSLAITGQLQVAGEVKPLGVHTPDEAMPPQRYIDELAKRGIEIRTTAG